MMLSILRVLGLAVLLLVRPPMAWASDSDGTIQDFKLTSWVSRDGAPTAAGAIAQTSDGYLWLGDPTGLYRFDAQRFEHVNPPGDPEHASAAVFSLFAPQSGGLWIGYTFGGASFMRDGQVTTYGVREGFPAGTTLSFAQQSDGTIWIGTSHGLGRLRNGRWEQLKTDSGLANVPINELMVDSAGAVWAANRGTLYRLEPGQRRFALIFSDTNSITTVAESPTGTVWAEHGYTLERVHQNAPSGHSRNGDRSGLIVDREGDIWCSFVFAGTNHYSLVRVLHPEIRARDGVILLQHDKDVLRSVGDHRGGMEGELLSDSEGNIWLSGGEGPTRISKPSLHPLTIEGTTLMAEIQGRLRWRPMGRFGLFTAPLVDSTLYPALVIRLCRG